MPAKPKEPKEPKDPKEPKEQKDPKEEPTKQTKVIRRIIQRRKSDQQTPRIETTTSKVPLSKMKLQKNFTLSGTKLGTMSRPTPVSGALTPLEASDEHFTTLHK